MTVVMLAQHVDETRDLDVVHEAEVLATAQTVGVTRCGLLFDFESLAPKTDPISLTGAIVLAREVNAAPSCLQCIVGL